jgi:LPS O-antigen subunit length determinant protein (WzzB/FepE family)
MTVSAVGQNDGSSRLNTIIKSTAVGTVGGYAMKYLWPVTKQENDITPRTMIKYCRKLTNNAKVQEINSLGVKTKAQDYFVKMIESGDKEAFTEKSIKDRVKKMGGEDSAAGKEFRAIIRNVNETASQMTKRWAIAYKNMLKQIRPTVPFLVAGAGIGFFTGFTHNVMKCDYNA